MGDGVDLGGSDTAQMRFGEYSITRFTTSRSDFFYPCCPSEPWPILKFSLYISRASKYYERALVMPVISLTALSLTAPLFDVKSGERLGFCTTLLLAMMAVDIITSGMLPVCDESVWGSRLSTISLFYAVASLAESCIVLSLYYLPDERVPRCVRWLQHRVAELCGRAGNATSEKCRGAPCAGEGSDVRPLEIGAVHDETQAGKSSPGGDDMGSSPSRSYAYDVDHHGAAGKEGRSGRETDTAEKREKYLSMKGLAPQNMQLALWIDRAAIVALPLGYLIQLKAMWSQLS